MTEAVPDDELVTCLECGAQFRTIGSSHLTKHGITIAQYRAKHPAAPLYPAGFLEEKGLAISRGWAKPGLKARESKKRHERYHHPKAGKKTRDALNQGRAEPARAKAQATMQLKAATDPNFSAKMGKISRAGYANATPEELARWNKNKQLAQLRPERRARQSEVAKGQWAKRNAELERLRAEAETTKRLRESGGKPVPRKLGRGKASEQERARFEIGQQVEAFIPVHRKQDRTAISNARKIVSEETHLQYKTVAEYHRQFRTLPPTIIAS